MARDFSRQFYKSKEWKQTREYVLKRDNYLCQHCNAPAQEVHHKKKLTPENIHDLSICLNPDNLISLCKDCHFKEHYQDKAEGHRTKPKEHELDIDKYEFDENGFLVEKVSPL